MVDKITQTFNQRTKGKRIFWNNATSVLPNLLDNVFSVEIVVSKIYSINIFLYRSIFKPLFLSNNIKMSFRCETYRKWKVFLPHFRYFRSNWFCMYIIQNVQDFLVSFESRFWCSQTINVAKVDDYFTSFKIRRDII